MKYQCFYPTATINLLFDKISKHLRVASLSLSLRTEGQRGTGWILLPSWGEEGFILKTSKRAAHSCGGRANLCHLLKPLGSSSLLGELLILSLYDLTCVTVLCMLACRKCYLLIHSWRIILFYLWLLSCFWLTSHVLLFFLSDLNLQEKRTQCYRKKNPKWKVSSSLPPRVHAAATQMLLFISVQEKCYSVKTHHRPIDFIVWVSSPVTRFLGSLRVGEWRIWLQISIRERVTLLKCCQAAGSGQGVAVCYCAAFLPKTRSLREMSRDAVMEEGWS